MRARSLKIPDETWRLCQEHARVRGVSVSQYIREAALMRLFYEVGNDGDREYTRAARAVRQIMSD